MIEYCPALNPMEADEVIQRFKEIYRARIKRPGADTLLDYLENKSDFFTAPASAKYHGAYHTGLCHHSLNVYDCLVNYLSSKRNQELTQISVERMGEEAFSETIAISALLHDICKIGCYRAGTRNVKNEDTGKWEKVPTFFYEDSLPYGHGEKSVYLVSSFMRLTRNEAMAIRWHMGFSGQEDSRTVGQAFTEYPLAFALATADMEATYYLETLRK